jgi:hypothetical protein
VRPRKRVLLLDSDEDRLGQLGFMLRTNRYRTTDCADAGVDLILAHWPCEADWRSLQTLCDCKTLFLKWKGTTEYLPEGNIILGNLSNMELLEYIGLMTARKRGPKKKLAEGNSAGERPASPGTVGSILEHSRAACDGAAA